MHVQMILVTMPKRLCMSFQPKSYNIANEPSVYLSCKKLKYVTSHKYLGVYICTNLKDDVAIGNQCRNLYSRGNMIIRNFKHCNDQVKKQLFQSFCTSIYCASLWSRFNIGSLRRLKVVYNRIFRILMNLQHRISMSHVFVVNRLDPFCVLMRKQILSFRKRITTSDNLLIKTIVDSVYFLSSGLTVRWNSTMFL